MSEPTESFCEYYNRPCTVEDGLCSECGERLIPSELCSRDYTIVELLYPTLLCVFCGHAIAEHSKSEKPDGV